jgi:hypothetical protein
MGGIVSSNKVNQTSQAGESHAEVKHVHWPVIRHQNELLQNAEIQVNGGRVYALQGKKIGEILNGLGVIDSQTLHAVEHHHNTKKTKSKPIGELLVHMGFINTEELTRALCVQSGVLMVALPFLQVPRDLLSLIPIEQAKIKKAIPVGTFNKSLYLAVTDPSTFADKQHFALFTTLNIKLVYAPLDEIQTFLDTTWSDMISSIWTG